jgi:hypothetical protein
METIIVVVCVGAGFNLALWGALCRKLAGLPAAFRAQVRRERSEGEGRAMAVLQEAAAAKVGSITLALRALEERAVARHRDEVAALEVRARVAERRALEVVPPLGAAVELVRALRSALDALSGLVTEPREPTAEHPADRVTPVLDSDVHHPHAALPLPVSAERDSRKEGAS